MSQEDFQGQESFKDLRESYEIIIRRIAATAQDFESLLRDVHDESIVTRNGYTQKAFQNLRERADSELLSIAFFGAFSSGKSFLISGLNRRIDWFQHDGRDQYAPLLPTSPRHTSSCPVAVEPLPSGQTTDNFSVLFEGAKIPEPKLPAHLAIIRAYVTDLPNARSERLNPKDRTRTVIAATIGIAQAKMKAKLYDLPGFGAIGVNYENVIRNFIQQADCIVYVAWAVRPLEDKDLELLRDIHNHHKDTGKPVFFVLTQIDLAWEYDTASEKVKWEDVLEANNEFLENNFLTSDGKPDSTFIGTGFIPVSSALEAKGVSLSVQEPETSKQLLVDSRMSVLRDTLNDYLQQTSGPLHLAELISEAQRLLARLALDIKQRNIAESTPLEEAKNALKGYKAQRSTLIEGKGKLEEELLTLGNSAINRAFAGSDPDDLASLLSTRLKEKVQDSDVLNEKIIHQIESEKAVIVREWLSRNAKALIPRWVSAWEAFFNQSNERVEQLMEKALAAQREAMKEQEDPENEVDITLANVEERLAGNYENSKTKNFNEMIDLLSKAWGTWAVIAGVGAGGAIGAATAAPAVPFLAAIGPVGWAILATAAVGAAHGQWKLLQERSQRREAIIKSFPTYAQQVVNAYRTQADEFIRTRIGYLIEIVDDEIESCSNSVNSLEQRLLTGEYEDRRKRLEILERLSQKCNEIDTQIKDFYRISADVRPEVLEIFGSIG